LLAEDDLDSEELPACLLLFRKSCTENRAKEIRRPRPSRSTKFLTHRKHDAVLMHFLDLS